MTWKRISGSMQRILSVYLNFKVLKCFCDSSSKFSYQSLYQQLLLKSPRQAVMIGSICQSGKIKSLPSFADADGHKFINSVCMTASIQFSPKIMHAQELLFASARRSFAADCGSLELESWKAQELLCGRIFKPQELLCGSLRWHFERNETGYM